MDYRHIVFLIIYTYQIFMCSVTVSKTYFAERLPPLDARAMNLFDAVE